MFFFIFLSPSLMSYKFHSLSFNRFSWEEKKNAVLSSHFFANSFLLAGAQISSRKVTCSEFLDLHFMHSIHSLDTVKFSQTIELSKYLKNLICPVYFEQTKIIIKNLSDKNIISHILLIDANIYLKFQTQNITCLHKDIVL